MVLDLESRRTLSSAKFKNVISALNASKLPYLIVGSCAVASYEPGYKVPDKIDDIDVLSPQVEAAKAVLLKEGLLYSPSGKKIADLGLNVSVDLSVPESPALRFRKFRVAVPTTTFNPVIRMYEEVEFPTVPASTLLHLQIKYLRIKDWTNVLALSRHLRAHPEDGLPESLYTDYHSFRKTVEKKYPFTAWLWKKEKEKARKGENSCVSNLEQQYPILKNIPSRLLFKLDRTLGEITRHSK